MRAALRGERDAGDLEALRAAGNWVYAELGKAEQTRSQLLADGRNLWTAPPATGGYLVACWNAFYLHSLGASLLDADYATDPRTVGYVPPVTFEQAWSWFAAAEGWLSHARQAESNPDYNLAHLVMLPADLPAWAGPDPCPLAHLRALMTAIPPVRAQVELALFDLEKHAQSESQRHTVNTVRQQAAEAAAAADYAQTLSASATTPRLRSLTQAHIRRSAGIWFKVGQFAAMPSLVGARSAKTIASRIDPQVLPGGSRFDPWCLTDPDSRAQWQSDPQAREAIAAMWEADPDPAHTLTIHAQIQAALASGAIVPVTGDTMASHFYSCPWYPMYQVRRRVKINGERLSVPQRFTLDVGLRPPNRGGKFVRRIVRGPFASTYEVDYGANRRR
ncbi:hypothetical protein Raf01_20100 [Rugosimonospora africana]|uniref:Uncharacterized protein n=1 Tax=Rugosimonospora africana TaxID=556532 RepID=A0A8J3QQX1_9ACTN|nr:hypothetical protein Raf01_20100 [Rugosimonospora africana]